MGNNLNNDMNISLFHLNMTAFLLELGVYVFLCSLEMILRRCDPYLKDEVTLIYGGGLHLFVGLTLKI